MNRLDRSRLFLVLQGLGRVVFGQYPPPPTYQSILHSPVDDGVAVYYNQPSMGTCTTAYSSQKQYTGYVSLPPLTLAHVQQNYSINSFFWFIEARQSPDTAPLTIWLNGGPGTSSMFGLFNEVGPCEVVQTADGTYGTQMRPFGWDRASNILFIDQPNQVGFSYDTATNASFDLFSNAIFAPPTSPNRGLPNYMYLNGTFGTASSSTDSQSISTANTTEIAAAATWHFLQTWLTTFPQYNPAVRPNRSSLFKSEPAGIHLFTESYGGRYGPIFASFFDDKNDAIANGTLSGTTAIAIELQSVGIVNGLIDPLVQDKFYPIFAYGNTYGIQAISLSDELNALTNFTNQCAPAIQACRSAGSDQYGDNVAANAACENANAVCNSIFLPAILNGYDPYDIRQKTTSPDPSAAYQEYLNMAPVLASIGARVNYTESNSYVTQAFQETGDMSHAGTIDDLAELLKRGVRVALIYGDADYICNWFGGQAIAGAIANTLPTFPQVSSSTSGANLSYASGFAAAGFADIVVNSTYVGGAVKQYGNLSFSRVYDAGHFVPYFQPETVFQIFARVILGDDISTGANVNLSSFRSNGPANSTHSNKVPPVPAQTCWVRSWNTSCSSDDTEAMLAGRGLVQNGIFYQDASSIILPSSTVVAGIPGQPISSASTGTAVMSQGTSTQLTGIYTATGTPQPSQSAAIGAFPPSSRRWLVLLVIIFSTMLCSISRWWS